MDPDGTIQEAEFGVYVKVGERRVVAQGSLLKDFS
jgi:hypothetical protein